MSAEIQDSVYNFSFKNPPSEYFGVSTLANSGQYEIYFYISNFDSGSYSWQSDHGMFGESPQVKLNGLEAIKGIGQLKITNHSHENKYSGGTFEFAVKDSLSNDTIFVKKGSFKFYYVRER